MINRALPLIAFCLLLPGCVTPATSNEGTEAAPVVARSTATASRDVVETYHPLSMKIGYDILEQGGNAFDAFVAATSADYVLGEGVTSIGGPLGVLVFDSKTRSAQYLNAGFNDPLDPRQKWDPKNPKIGSSALVPGAIAGLEALSKKFGRLSFKVALAPAIELAENGFPISRHYSNLITLYAEKLKRTSYGRKTFFINGQPLKEGDVLRLPELASFLRRLASQGSRYAYEGDWAKASLKTINMQGGHLTVKDFTAYRPEWESTLQITYKGLDLFFPKTYGSMIDSMALKTLESTDLIKYGRHYTDTAEGLGYVDLVYIESAREAWLYDETKFKDEAFLKRMLASPHIQEIRSRVDQKISTALLPDKGTHSLQVTIIDHDGNAVTGTNTIEGLPWGEGLFVEGVTLSSAGELPFSTAPGKRRRFGLAMHIGTRNGKVHFASGTFNSSLVPAEFQLVLNLVNYKMRPLEAVTAPRFGVPAWDINTMKQLGGQWLDPRVSSDVVANLVKYGAQFNQQTPVDTGLGAVALVDDSGHAEGAIAPFSPWSETKQVGIGISLGSDASKHVIVTKVLPGSPAAKSQIKEGDAIASVQSRPGSPIVITLEMQPAQVLPLMRGLKGEQLMLELIRNNTKIPVTLFRDEFIYKPN